MLVCHAAVVMIFSATEGSIFPADSLEDAIDVVRLVALVKAVMNKFRWEDGPPTFYIAALLVDV